MRRRLSIGAQWTLRYTLALLVTVSVFAIYTYTEIARRTERDAQLVLELLLAEVADQARMAGDDLPSLVALVEQDLASADNDLKLGFAIHDAEGALVFARGSLERHPAPLRSGPGEGPFLEEVDFGDSYPYLLMAVPAGSAHVQGALYMRPFVRNAREVRDIYLYSMPVLLLFTAALGYALARGSLRPLSAMNRTARRISGTHLDERIPTTGSGDELDELAETLNDMISRISRSVERMRRFSGNAAHELRTPLNALRSRLEVTLGQPRDPEEIRKALVETAEEVRGFSNVVHSMMRLAQSEAGLSPEQTTPVDLAGLLREVVDFFEPLAEEAEVELEVAVGAPAVIPGDAAWLHELFANLLDNAIKYSSAGGRVRLELEHDEGSLIAHVRDDGIGIAEEDLPRVFQPFHRVGNRSEAPGVGLGLPIAREIARAHGGELFVESELGRGTRFSVRLPVGT